jgi:hypothetical protein
MDFLDSRKAARENILLLIGYVLIAVAVVLITLLLWRMAEGFGIDKKGQVIQRGLTFFSSHPSPADIRVNGQLESVKTNTRLVLPEGIYNVTLSRTGYYDWQRKIEVSGGKVLHFDYPFLFPKNAAVKKIASYAAGPAFSTQSPDHRWLMVQKPGALTDFDMYDLKNPDKTTVLPVALPSGIVTGGTSQSWQLGEWSADNRHVLLEHDYDGKTEFIMFDRTNPELSVNLNTTLSAAPAKITLNDRKYDRYYLLTDGGALQTASLDKPSPLPLLEHVLAYKTYGGDTVLYVTDNGAPAGKVLLKMAVGGKTYTIRKLPAGTSYVVDLTSYSGDMYVAAGVASDNRVYIYKDPAGQIDSQPRQAPVITQVLHVANVNFLSFSANAQFIAAENGSRFGIYDIENQAGYNYAAAQPLDSPQAHAAWMDGDRLAYVSQGKLVVFDYDYLNLHTAGTQSSAGLPAFSPDYKYVYGLAPSAGGQTDLNQTALVTAADR